MSDKFKIYTKTGDDGTSGLIGGTRVEKSDARLEAYGTVDELNAWIGVLRCGNDDKVTDETLEMVQNKLFVIGSHLATDTSKSNMHQQLPCNPEDAKKLEQEIDRMQEVLPQLTNFVMPGGALLSAQAHVARTVCRRAERRATALGQTVPVEREVLIFLNRLSDYLFVLSRFFNHLAGEKEVYWKPVKS
jgi:cob(I)alamin adenosyltransferase